jgi:hypothetical protein
VGDRGEPRGVKLLLLRGLALGSPAGSPAMEAASASKAAPSPRGLALGERDGDRDRERAESESPTRSGARPALGECGELRGERAGEYEVLGPGTRSTEGGTKLRSSRSRIDVVVEWRGLFWFHPDWSEDRRLALLRRGGEGRRRRQGRKPIVKTDRSLHSSYAHNQDAGWGGLPPRSLSLSSPPLPSTPPSLPHH